ncbi:MAG: hypothetical protein HYX94_13370 [Chloroflexi bacterium]|nr:hypothetical protein [Chloroflexota bacterium]
MPDGNSFNREDPQSFIVRVWREGLGRWRGKISHVQSHEGQAFTRLEEITQFMAARLPEIEFASSSERPEVRRSSLLSWLPRRRSLRLAMGGIAVCAVAAAVVLAYPAGSPAGGMVGTAQGSDLDTTLIFFLGALVGGAAVGIWTRLRRRI